MIVFIVIFLTFLKIDKRDQAKAKGVTYMRVIFRVEVKNNFVIKARQYEGVRKVAQLGPALDYMIIDFRTDNVSEGITVVSIASYS